MPRYFFTTENDSVLDDIEGEELPSLEAALTAAEHIAGDLEHSNLKNSFIVVRDDQGTEIARVQID